MITMQVYNACMDMKFVDSLLLPGGHGALADSGGDSGGLATLAPLQQSNGHDADEEDHSSHQTSTAGAAESLLHVGEPEGADETPC